jgi:DNA invertase Pin-like site-specific DNA recombinase
MSKVYGYCRTALTEGNNMEVQCAVVEDYCKSRGMKLEKCFCDPGVSAHNMNREGLDELLDVLEDGDVVVTRDISRFARDMVKLEMVVDKIRSIGVEIVYVDEPESDTSPIEDWLRSKLG